MGAKNWMVITCDGDPRDLLKAKPVLDRDASEALARRLFPKSKLKAIEDTDLHSTCPRGSRLVIGVFPGMTIVAAEELTVDHPSRLPEHLRTHSGHEWAYLHLVHSVVNWFAYGIWRRGELVRSLSLSLDSGVAEDIGARQPFELPYWAGTHVEPEDAEDEDYPFPFDPLDLGQGALRALFGYQLEGDSGASLLDPASIKLMQFERSKRWFSF